MVYVYHILAYFAGVNKEWMVWQIKHGKATLTDILLYAGLATPFPDKLKQTVCMHLHTVFVSSFAMCIFVLVCFVEACLCMFACVFVDVDVFIQNVTILQNVLIIGQRLYRH